MRPPPTHTQKKQLWEILSLPESAPKKEEGGGSLFKWEPGISSWTHLSLEQEGSRLNGWREGNQINYQHKRSISAAWRDCSVLETQWESTEAVWSCRRDFPLSKYPKAMRCISCANWWAPYFWSRPSTSWRWPRNRLTLSPPSDFFGRDIKRVMATSCGIARLR